MPILSNSKHERFAQAIAQGRSASAAYVEAGYPAHGSNAGRLSKNEFVRARVDELLAIGAEKAGVTIERIVTELAKIGFSDIRKVVRWSGVETADELEEGDDGIPKVKIRAANFVRLIDSDVVDDDTAGAIAEVSQTREGALKLKMYDKLSALEKLGKHVGMFKDGASGGAPVEHRFTFKLDRPTQS